jgi:hypothetical protein
MMGVLQIPDEMVDARPMFVMVRIKLVAILHANGMILRRNVRYIIVPAYTVRVYLFVTMVAI